MICYSVHSLNQPENLCTTEHGKTVTAKSIEVFDEVVCLGRSAHHHSPHLLNMSVDRYDTAQYTATINIVVRKKEGLNKQQTAEEVLKSWNNNNTIDQKIFTFKKDFVTLQCSVYVCVFTCNLCQFSLKYFSNADLISHM